MLAKQSARDQREEPNKNWSIFSVVSLREISSLLYSYITALNAKHPINAYPLLHLSARVAWFAPTGYVITSDYEEVINYRLCIVCTWISKNAATPPPRRFSFFATTPSP